MGRTYKDSKQATVLHVIKREDGTFDFFLNREIDGERLTERSLEDRLCRGFGYCQDEFKLILEEVNRDGDTTRSY